MFLVNHSKYKLTGNDLDFVLISYYLLDVLLSVIPNVHKYLKILLLFHFSSIYIDIQGLLLVFYSMHPEFVARNG